MLLASMTIAAGPLMALPVRAFADTPVPGLLALVAAGGPVQASSVTGMARARRQNIPAVDIFTVPAEGRTLLTAQGRVHKV